MPLEIQSYQTFNGKKPFREWLLTLQDGTIKARIRARLEKVSEGNLGDIKHLGDGINELRLYFRAGYRIYFSWIENNSIVLLCGGDKNSQEKDIKKAKEYWQDYRRQKNV